MAPPDRLAQAPVALERLTGMPLFGRGALLASAELALQRAASGAGASLLVLRGEPGIGKTRCADGIAARARSQGYDVLEARCHEMDGAPALWPWAEILRRLGEKRGPRELGRIVRPDKQVLARILPELQTRNRERDDAERAESDAPHRLFEAVTRALQRAAQRAPLLVTIDDLHWGEPASARLARFAARELREARIVFCLLHRTDEVRADSPLAKALDELTREAETFALEGLAPSEVGELVAHVAGGALDSPLARALSARTAGNPLFVKETLRVLALESRLDAQLASAAPLPVTVRHTLERRLALLPPASQRALQQAAVFGVEFSASALERACAAQGLAAEKALDEGLRLGILQPARGAVGRHRFAHDLYRETALACATLGELALHHQHAAEALRSLYEADLEPHAAQLAFHYLACGIPELARDAARFSFRAARAAMRSFSFEKAIELFASARKAFDSMEASGLRDPEVTRLRCETELELGHSLWQVGRRREAAERYATSLRLAREARDPMLFARAAIAMGGRNDVPMDFPDASVRFMEEALSGLPRDDSRLRVHLLAALVRAKYFGDERAQLTAWGREAVAIAGRIGGTSVRFAALEALHYALMTPDGLSERLLLSNQLAALAAEWGSPRAEAIAQLWRTVDLMEAADMFGADSALTLFERAAEALRQPYYRWLAVGLRATRAHAQGRLEEAEKLIFEALRLGQEADTPNALLFFGTQLFHLREEQGRVDELLALMQRIVAERPALPVFRIGIPLIHALAGRLDEARAAFEQVAANDFADVPRDLHRAPMLTSAATVAALIGDQRRAALLYDELRSLAGKVMLAGVGTYWGGATDRMLAALANVAGDVEGAIRYCEAAVALARRAGARLHEAHALGDLARLLARRGIGSDAQRAEAAQRGAHTLYRTLGASWRVPADAAAETRPAPTPHEHNTFAWVRRRWVVSFEGERIELPASKGLGYLRALLAAPEREIHVLELIAERDTRQLAAGVRDASLAVRRGDSGFEVADARALRAYRERLRELERASEEAERHGDLGRREALAKERDALERELKAALGARGRRRLAASAVERARKAAYNRIRGAIARIAEAHPPLGRHLDRSVHTGTTCAYRPELDPSWHLDTPEETRAASGVSRAE